MKTFKNLASVSLILMFIVFGIQSESQANMYSISESLSGLEEVPPNASPGTGLLTGTYDDVTKILSINITFSGLFAGTTAAHFHLGAAGVNGPVQLGLVGFPTGVTNGLFNNNYVLTALQESDMLNDLWYLNIHTTQIPGGEIRTQVEPEIILPIELSSFSSVIKGNDVLLNWSTSSEVNNSGFDIERSNENSVWEKIGFINGAGNSNESHSYFFKDNDLNTGVYNYRLKQIDFNGNFEYYNLSNEISIGTPENFELSQNYPNPFNPETNIDFTIPENGNVSLQLYDYTGRLVKTLFGGFKSAGYYSYKLNASDISSGIYFYKLESGNQSITKKLMLVK
ncbi:MAG: CHRD domain-containing protein [Ignavibacteria bacterium]